MMLLNNLPELKPSGRAREYKYYTDLLKAKVVYEHLTKGLQHRELDEVVLGLDKEISKGFQSMGILHYLGMKSDYKGLFDGYTLEAVISIFNQQGDGYEEAIRLLKLLKDNLLGDSIDQDIEAEIFEDGYGVEGRVKYYFGKGYERDSKNRRLAVERHGLNCYVCNFNFEAVYGERGKDYIEIHHIQPLSTLSEVMEVNPETDLVPLCANCHRMIHRRKDNVLSVEELKSIL